MANINYSLNIDLQTSDGCRYQKQVVNADANAKLILDDVFAAGTVVDLVPYLASITVPLWLLVVADGDGVLLNVDGLGNTTKYYKMAFFQCSYTLPAPQGAINLSITVAAAPSVSQRIQVFAIGDV